MRQHSENGKSHRPSCVGDAATRDGFSARLIRRAAARAPAALAPRLEEEWLADLTDRPTAVSRVRFALGCCWAARVITRDWAMASVAVAVVAGPRSGAPWGDEPHPVARLSRRAVTLGLVACLHVAVFYAFLFGLPITAHETPEPPLQTKLLPPVPKPAVPRPPPPILDPLKLYVPPLDLAVPITPADSNDTIRDVIPIGPTIPEGPGTPPSTPHVAKQIQGGPGSGFPNPDDYYPVLARHLEEQGVAVLRVCVDPGGRLTSDPVTLASAGSSRLDDGALKLARAGSGHYRATTEDGKPVSACYPLRIRFQIRK